MRLLYSPWLDTLGLVYGSAQPLRSLEVCLRGPSAETVEHSLTPVLLPARRNPVHTLRPPTCLLHLAQISQAASRF